jgi:hypothetical protein
MSDVSAPAPTGLARRAFVTALAGAAAAALVAPAASLASGGPDPIFALIETHRALAKEYAAACAEQSRREEILIDEGIGLSPFVVVVGNGRPIVAYTHPQIDAFGDIITEQVKVRGHADLDRTLARYREVFGNIENEAGEIGDREIAALEDLVRCTPSSMVGLRALLSYLEFDLEEGRLDNVDARAALVSVNDTLDNLYPAANGDQDGLDEQVPLRDRQNVGMV